ncbi:MAG TPA: crosslink repair DNA glycosylase YcaQ family protein [Kofleriaceae bacterium]|nr:crosslink repair DNA glycosylase YcaQ family protein [Kofleriaceae bacterium]
MTPLSAAEARALALAAQGLATPRPRAVTRRDLRALVERLGVVQIDSVNVLVRAHYLPAWSRLGAYDRAAFDALSHRAPRALFEYWGHEASLLPVALHPLLRWRMAKAHAHAWRFVRRISKRQGFLRDIRALVAERGPITARELPAPRRKRTGWWEWSDAKKAIEWLFYAGEVTSAGRRGFERLYDLPERVLPAAILAAPTPSEHDAQRALVEIAARALGVATDADLRHYYNLSLAATRRAIEELVEAGTLDRVSVEGWARPGYRHEDARPPRAIDRARVALVSPFDSLVWTRERTERLFGMRYRIEIYTPEPRRVHGYYVLPLLVGDRLVGRVDLKADRAAGVLRVQASHVEPGATPREVAAALAGELGAMARWLELERVEVVERGALAPVLRRVGRAS